MDERNHRDQSNEEFSQGAEVDNIGQRELKDNRDITRPELTGGEVVKLLFLIEGEQHRCEIQAAENPDDEYWPDQIRDLELIRAKLNTAIGQPPHDR